ncbi:hypothetical protein HS048_36465 [Planomonospora sp. ID91781]|uniref:hypothetical protein n=1 Tax=Planomonospora sp. ID91781 TaxID=2738135 RepID=UPI0018C367B3|nr:hypothetical protein [Planomonospora sp. ID91781]MBG0826163.1 hypothetical protein [Planomonospora sp. ID91781]
MSSIGQGRGEEEAGNGSPYIEETDLSKEEPSERADLQLQRTTWDLEFQGSRFFSVKIKGESPSWGPTPVAVALFIMVAAAVLAGLAIATIGTATSTPGAFTMIGIIVICGFILMAGVIAIFRFRHRE